MSSQNTVKASAEGVAASAKAASKGRGLPPVHKWDPPDCGALDMRIARDGSWHYQGSPINRPELVRLFSTILRKDGDSYVLVTPVEKVTITVEDAPFVAVAMTVAGQGRDQALTFRSNLDEEIVAGPTAPIRVTIDPATEEPSPYVLVRANLEALIDRKSFYRLVERGAHHEGWFGVWSDGAFFKVIPSDQLP